MADTDDSGTAVEEPVEEQKLDLDVKIDKPGACQRHITVSVSRDDVDRYYDDAFSEMMDSAEVPGFRTGRAPRKLIESRFRKEVGEQIKGKILMDSLGQISDEEELSAISEPDLDLDAVEIPDEGPMTFEFDIEVRPEFDMPNWKGLKIERPVHEFTEEDVDVQIRKILARFARMVPVSDPISLGDYVTFDLEFSHDGNELWKRKEQVISVRPTLSFQDGKLEGFDKLAIGTKSDDKFEGKLKLSDEAPNEALRGEEVAVEFKVLDIKRVELPRSMPSFSVVSANSKTKRSFATM